MSEIIDVLPVPLEERILVKMDPIDEEVIKQKVSVGGIIVREKLTRDEQDRIEHGRQTGVIAAMSRHAWADYGDDKPAKVGDRIYFRRYSGSPLRTKEGDLYLLMHDHEALCVLPENYTAGVQQVE